MSKINLVYSNENIPKNQGVGLCFILWNS